MSGEISSTPRYNVNEQGQRLTAGNRWCIFIDRVCAGTSPRDAAALAGYANPEETAAQLLRLPAIRKALSDAIEGRLLSEAAPVAVHVALSILNDAEAPASIRGKMAVAILDRTRAKPDAVAQDAPGSMSGLGQADLERLVAQLQASGAVVVPVSVTPRSGATPSDDDDNL